MLLLCPCLSVVGNAIFEFLQFHNPDFTPLLTFSCMNVTNSLRFTIVVHFLLSLSLPGSQRYSKLLPNFYSFLYTFFRNSRKFWGRRLCPGFGVSYSLFGSVHPGVFSSISALVASFVLRCGERRIFVVLSNFFTILISSVF